jgi:D-arginine dehydrogenase
VRRQADIIVIGAGIAGASVAARLAAYAQVVLLERETVPGYHSSGRSAAFFSPSYGNPAICALTAASEPFYRSPPTGFTHTALLRPRGCLHVARPDQRDSLAALRAQHPTLQELLPQQCHALAPLIPQQLISAGLLDDAGGDLDVDAIMQGFLRNFRQAGGVLATSNEVLGLDYRQGQWRVNCKSEALHAPVIVNATGAWADATAERAGLAALGITPLRRTAMIIEPPAGMDVSDMPMVTDIDEQYYFKPEAGKLLLSPADETPGPPCDAQAEEIDIAVAADRYCRATGLPLPKITHHWAGLRSFAPDRNLVIGFDPRASGFFWLAGQGGYGFQSAPALSELAAHMLLGKNSFAASDPALGWRDTLAPDRLLNTNAA